MSQSNTSAHQGAKPEIDEALVRVLDAMNKANETDPRKVARRYKATAFHLSEGGSVTVRGMVGVTWPAEYWRPMCDAVRAGGYHLTETRDGRTLVLEVQ